MYISYRDIYLHIHTHCSSTQALSLSLSLSLSLPPSLSMAGAAAESSSSSDLLGFLVIVFSLPLCVSVCLWRRFVSGGGGGGGGGGVFGVCEGPSTVLGRFTHPGFESHFFVYM